MQPHVAKDENRKRLDVCAGQKDYWELANEEVNFKALKVCMNWDLDYMFLAHHM